MVSNEEIKVSIIVPIYNVESYISDCVQSLRKQTLQDIEIILVDDGSKDSSGLLCDSFAAEDPRIRVVHKENGGLSSARNAGIAIARGRYLGFLDGDDVIAPQMYERLYQTAEENQVEIAVCDLQELLPGMELAPVQPGKPILLSHHRALKELFLGRLYFVSAWNKLYLRSTFADVHYPEGKIHEDMFTTYQVFEKSQRVAFLPEKLYGYRLREGSITRVKFDARRFHNLEALCQIIDFYQDAQADLREILYRLYFEKSTYLLNLICRDCKLVEAIGHFKTYRQFVMRHYDAMMDALKEEQRAHLRCVKKWGVVFCLRYKYQDSLARFTPKRVAGKLKKIMRGDKK